MKKANKNMVKTSEVRAEIKTQKGSVCQVIKGIYSYVGEETPKLKKILPANAKDLCAISARICKELHVGEVVVDKQGNKKLTAKGEERVHKFTQSALISWLIKNQKELKNILKEEAAKKAASSVVVEEPKAEECPSNESEGEKTTKGLAKRLFGKKSA